MARETKLSGWAKGANNRARPSELPEDTARDLVNVDPHANGSLTLRTGYTKIMGGSAIRGVLAYKDTLLVADGSDLIKFNTLSDTFETIATISAAGPFVGDILNDELYFFTADAGYKYGREGLESWAIEFGSIADVLLRDSSTSELVPYSLRGAGDILGHAIQAYNGSLYIAQDNILWFTTPMLPTALDRGRNFFQFPSRISILAAVADGVYVVADRTYFISASAGDAPTQRVLSDTTGIEGTMVSIPPTDKFSQRVAWMTEYGLAIGDGGAVSIPSQSDFIPQTSGAGASGVLEYNGNQLVVTAIDPPPKGAGLAASDFYQVEVINPS